MRLGSFTLMLPKCESFIPESGAQAATWYGRIGSYYFMQTLISGGVLWEPLPPGRYVSKQTGQIVEIYYGTTSKERACG